MRPRPGSLNGFFGTTVGHRTRYSAAVEQVASALSRKVPWQEKLQECTDALVRHLDASAARVWTLTENRRALALQANSGSHPTPGNGKPHLPVVSPALRSIIEEGVPYITRDAVNDPDLRGIDWGPGGRVAYAGYPLLVGAQAEGVLAMFSWAAMSRMTLDTIGAIADMLAQALVRVHGESTPRHSEAFRTEAQRLNALLVTMRHAIDHSPTALSPQIQVLRDRYASLSRCEREVMALVVTGRLNKQVGARLGISEITVKAHRGQVMRKMRALSLADLVKIAVLLQLAPLSWN